MSVVKAPFRFRKTNLSTIMMIAYTVITIVYVWDHFHYQFAPPQEMATSKMLEDAWLDLEIITQYPHPYSSHANDKVHDYLLERITDITKDSSFAHVSDDYGTGIRTLFREEDILKSKSHDSKVVYYESSNVLAKVEGRDPTLEGLLLSAHFDSVPSGFGATDDGMGIVSMLAILAYYAKNQPERTIVFNFNNNEEFGLAGASAFFEHPWSKGISYVINLEGAGSGGKAVLFRTSDVATASVYADAVRDQPFGNSMYQQGFYSGHIGSESDFRVYQAQGLRGWDIAFYKPRNLYHTAKDTVLYTSKQALWHMLHTTLQLTAHMAVNKPEMEDTSSAVYFDLFGKWFVVWSAKSLFYWNCIILALFPSLLAILFLIAHDQQALNVNLCGAMCRLPVSVAVAYFGVKLFQVLVGQINPYVFSRDYVPPIVAEASLFVFINYLILSSWEQLRPLRDFKTLALVEVSMFLWVYLVSVTRWLRDSNYKATGVYPFTVGYVFVSIGAVIGVFCATLKAKYSMAKRFPIRTRKITHKRRGSDAPQVVIAVENTIIDTENTPLLTPSQNSHPGSAKSAGLDCDDDDDEGIVATLLNYDWSIQFLVVTPAVTYFTWVCLDLIMSAMNQTIQENAKSTTFVTHMALIGSLLLTLPLLPFAYQLHSVVALLFLVLAVVAGFWTIVVPPFTESSPLKLEFVQTIDLDMNNSSTVYLYGREKAFMEPILDDIPSVDGYECHGMNSNGVDVCQYTGMLPKMFDKDHNIHEDWGNIMTVEIINDDRNSSSRTPYQPITAELRINVADNRVCTLSFNSTKFESWKHANSPVREVTILNEKGNNKSASVGNNKLKNGYFKDEEGNDHFRWNNGITELQLHKLDFDRGYYSVSLEWIPQVLYRAERNEPQVMGDDDDALGVSITCYWGEYDTNSITDGFATTNVPAYDELRKYSPKNIIYSSREKGMILVKKYIEL
ncbi:HGR048Cp [Eremothecium sinecaudum]|uniref:Peptide hydrolase n=1 Tax=Eremothecium sinecaudum TaxID=45286 RepID=A0A0X8HVP6_9SACH|nr:HGR048Cp [Eremothecium sinecaudum]AMD22387.1 HGR048Cp [Eremothecium sinecaudum]